MDNMTDKVGLITLAVGVGVVIAVHLAMNARIGEMLGSPRTGNSLFWIIGALTGLIIWVASGEWQALKNVGQVHPSLWLAGAMGASIVLATAFLIPRLGVGPTTVALVGGQIAAGVIMSHFGWLSTQVTSLDPARLTGLGLMAIGIGLVMK